MKITKQVIEFLLTINGREEQGSFDGHVFTLKGVTGDQITRLGAAIEREFAVTGDGVSPLVVETRGKVVGVRIVEGPLTQLDERALTDAAPGDIVTLADGRRIEIQANGLAVVRRETIEASPTAEQIAKQRRGELDAQHHARKFTKEEVAEARRVSEAQREADEAAAAEQARKKVEAERAAEADARARREAERQRQDQEAADRKAADDANFRREREAAARELAEEQKRRDEEIARESADRARREAEKARLRAEEQKRQDAAAAAQTAREIAEGEARTSKLVAEQAERDRAEARAKEKAELDASMAKAAAEDAARKQREEAEKAASKPALHVVPPPAPSEPKGVAVAPNGKPVPPPPADVKLPSLKLTSIVTAAHALGFRTLADLDFVLFTVWKDEVPMLRALSGTAEEKRGRIANVCQIRKLELDGGPAQVDDSDDE